MVDLVKRFDGLTKPNPDFRQVRDDEARRAFVVQESPQGTTLSYIDVEVFTSLTQSERRQQIQEYYDG